MDTKQWSPVTLFLSVVDRGCAYAPALKRTVNMPAATMIRLGQLTDVISNIDARYGPISPACRQEKVCCEDQKDPRDFSRVFVVEPQQSFEGYHHPIGQEIIVPSPPLNQNAGLLVVLLALSFRQPVAIALL